LPYKKVDIRRELAAQNRAAQGPPGFQPPASGYPTTPTARVEPEPQAAPHYAAPAANGARSALNLDDELDVPDFLKP
jgi:hypothetical protein